MMRDKMTIHHMLRSILRAERPSLSTTEAVAKSNANLSHPKYRPDIDGLRAVAVMSVVTFHAFPKLLSGGFIGVDVFFVISGFLISTIIFQSLDRGTFSFREFYARRIKRIFPALFLVLAACFAFGWTTLFADEFQQLGKHIAAGAGFVSNLILWREAGYFDNSGDTKPLLHLWSLGIEEQFYILWPLLVWAAWKVRLNLLVVAVLVAAASFALNIHGLRVDSVGAFYSPQSRFWELLSGSILAWIFLYQSPRLARVFANCASFVGAVLLAFGFWHLSKASAFPGWWAIVPVFGAVLIIASGPQAWFNRKVLSTRIAVSVGLISFPLYLWHWPLLSFARIIQGGEPSVILRVLVVALSILLAWVTYRLVERRVRGHDLNRIVIPTLATTAALVGAVGLYAYAQDGLANRASIRGAEALREDLNFQYDKSKGWLCDNTFVGTYCSYHGKPPFAVVIGDSHAPRIYAALKDIYLPQGRGLANIGSDACPALIDVIGINDPPTFNPDCLNNMSNVIKRVAADKSVDTVYLLNRGPLYTTGKGVGELEAFYSWSLTSTDRTKPKQTNEVVYRDALNETIKLLLAANKKVVYFIDTPELGFDIKACVKLRPLSFASDRYCGISAAEYARRSSDYKKMVHDVLDPYKDVKVIDLSEPLCDRQYCHGEIDGRPMYTDDDHLSLPGAKYVLDKVKNQL